MIVQGIPSSHIVRESARRNKDYEVDFVNAESNNEIYTLKAFLRRSEMDNDYKIKVIIISSILAYPAFETSWSFGENEYDLASRVFHRVCDEVDDVKTDFDTSMIPVTVISGKIREALRFISESHIEKSHILSIDESRKEKGEPDIRLSIYHGHYPNMSKSEKHGRQTFEGNESEQEFIKKRYSTREKY